MGKGARLRQKKALDERQRARQVITLLRRRIAELENILRNTQAELDGAKRVLKIRDKQILKMSSQLEELSLPGAILLTKAPGNGPGLWARLAWAFRPGRPEPEQQ